MRWFEFRVSELQYEFQVLEQVYEFRVPMDFPLYCNWQLVGKKNQMPLVR